MEKNKKTFYDHKGGQKVFFLSKKALSLLIKMQ